MKKSLKKLFTLCLSCVTIKLQLIKRKENQMTIKELAKVIYKNNDIATIKKELADYGLEFDNKVSKMQLVKVLAEKQLLG